MSHIKKIDEMVENQQDSFDVQFAKELSNKYHCICWDIENTYPDAADSYETMRNHTKGKKVSPNDYAESAKKMIDFFVKDDHCKKKRIVIPKNILYHFAELTSQNHHYEVRYEIANYLSHYSDQFEEYKAFYKYIIDKGNDYIGNTNPFGSLQHIVTDCMFAKIASVFGGKVAMDIDACL
jgi:hypothetical protein